MMRRAHIALLLCLLLPCCALSQRQDAWRTATHVAGGSSLVVMDWASGAVLASAGPQVRATPGSAIKPLLLAYALRHGITAASHSVYCRGSLRVGTHSVACTHPTDLRLLDAETALAESCNTWFAEMGRQYTGAQLDAALTESHLSHRASLLHADAMERQLAVLGIEGVTVTPREMAAAYRAMLRTLQPSEAVWRGMRGSVMYGMAHGADIRGVELLGKTGTAAAPGQISTHGWFVGAVPGRYVVVLYVPQGDGGEAARVARLVLEAAPR